ncbi:unnamed protein product [Linum trigynum]|uniref:TIR domain-containing protein n=1 Tax=Linum trigynum TaxID=586398 RepID=A0AAV2D3J8_9ROSI
MPVMGKLGKRRESDRRCDDEEEQLALTPSQPSKRQKKLLISTNDLLILPTKLCNWLRHKFVRPLHFTPPSSSSSSSSSSDLIPFGHNSSNSSGASGPGLSKYDAFISFRGADVRNSFLSHLYYHLHNLQKLAVYKDDVDLERGEQISPSLLLAIQRSDVYIVVLSPKYTDSPWCLEELEEILRCMKLHGRRVIPVFYGVDPSEVENQKLPSATAWRIRSWRAALSEVANLSGFDSQVIRPETKLIEEIVKAVFQAIHYSCSQMVKFPAYSASRGLVGVERQIEQLQALLCSDGRSNWTIGLWGMGGIGKTALAKAFFDLFSCRFEASYFFSNFTDTISGGPSLQPFGNLQNHLFSKLLGDGNGRAGGGAVSYGMAVHRLSRMKSLVVIDDVGNDVGEIGPLKDMLNGQYCNLFGPGSVIIMTGRNKQLLKNVCDHVYEVKGLDCEEASELFCLHAFRGESAQIEYLDMVERAIRYVDGNPLAITILGAHLFGRDLQFWDRELGALEDNPNSVVQNVLRRSYDGLSRVEKDIFLDLACFFPYWRHLKLVYIEEIMGLECGRVNLITNLVDKSLISINVDEGYIEMNSLLQDLGRYIVDEEWQIEKRSRLWRSQDLYYLFRENKGTESTEGILLLDNQGYKEHILLLQPDTFTRMKRLRFLIISNQASSLVLPKDGLNCLPNTLRILDWYSLTSKCLPSQFSAENLITLNMTNSQIEQLWEGDELDADLGNLKFLNLHGSESLRKLPDLSTAKKLKEIDLPFCTSLVELPSSILYLPKLESLNLWGCSSLKLENLEDYANSNPGPSTGHHDILPSLRELDLSYTPIQKVPNFITRLHILELQCLKCTKLTEFPVIPSLESFTLTRSLIKEVVELEKLTELKFLRLSDNEQLVLVSGDLSKLKSLEEIHLDDCSKLSSLPESSGILMRMESPIGLFKLSLQRCKSLARLPDSIGNLMNLGSLDLRCTAVKELPSSVVNIIRLSELILQECKSLACLPDTIHKLTNLNTLNLFGCVQLRNLPELPPSLKNLDAHGCNSLQTLSIGTVEKHDFSNIDWCFGQCWKLDPVVYNKLVDKFTQDSVRNYYRSSLLLPAKWGGESGDEEGHPWKW